MSRVTILDEATVGQIAAGEVVERPASVVKELLENGIDAGATRLVVSVTDGGNTCITVSDNGSGMDQEDAVLALQPHATSKIRHAGELPQVQTLGFRGEALAGISTVSALELITRPRDAEMGVRLLARGGRITVMEAVGAPPGTSISVRHLFFNAPMRRRYLKAPATELGHISDCVAQYALARPEISFHLAQGEETLLHYAGSGQLADAAAAVCGAEAARQMLPVAVPGEQCALTGLIARPSLTRGTRAWQWFFINRRPIRSKTLAHAVEQAYYTLVPPGRFPVVILLLQLEPSLVDVNVHPAKSEVRFLAEGELHRFVSRALRQTLEAADLTPQVSETPLSLPAASPSPPHAAPPAETLPLPLEPEEPPPAIAPFPEARAQILNTYILAEGPEGLYIIDQHTAHERGLYEQLRRGGAAQQRPQPLTVPLSLTLGAREAAVLRAHLAALHDLGFQVEPFGRDSFLVRAAPAALAAGDCERLLRETLDELAQEHTPQALETRQERLAALIACRSAVKAGDRLTLPEMQAILRGLYALPQRFTCQHGRPTVILLSREELEKRFHR